MRKPVVSRMFVAFLLACIPPSSIPADGAYFSRSVTLTSDQRAIIIRNGNEISMTLSTAYTGDGDDFGWVIPTPVPIAAGDIRETPEYGETAFARLDKYSAPRVIDTGCFPAGTEVLTAQGPQAIEIVDSGTEVYSYDRAARQWVRGRVRERQSHLYRGDMSTIRLGNATILATGNHPFFVIRGNGLVDRPVPRDVPENENQTAAGDGRWVEARDLMKEDVLANRSSEGLTVTEISSRNETAVVYNLDVEGCHTYAVHRIGALVHNKGSRETSAPVGVSIYATVALTHYEASILGATSASALLGWLESSGYRAGLVARDVIDAYIDRGWAFVAVKLNPSEKRRYENEFLHAITMAFRSDQLVFPVQISSVSTVEAVRITLFVIAESTVSSSNYSTKTLRYDKTTLSTSRDPGDYILERIRETVGTEGRGLAVLWKGGFVRPRTHEPYDPQEIRELMNVPFPTGRRRYLTRLETVLDPSDMTEDIWLRLDRRPKEFHVDNLGQRPVQSAFLLGILGFLCCIAALAAVLIAQEVIALAGVMLTGPILLIRMLVRSVLRRGRDG